MYERHRKLVGAFHLALAATDILVCLIVFTVLGASAVFSGDPEAARVLGGVTVVVCVILGILAVPRLIAGYGAIGGRPWGRTAVIVSSVLSLASMPLGTAVGVYSLYVCLGPEGDGSRDGTGRQPPAGPPAGAPGGPQAPPPAG